MFSWLEKSKVVVCVGSGGVGKTTVAAALAYYAAKEGRKVLVLTVDPAQRLKTTLGLAGSIEIVKIEDPSLKGELSASVIDPKKTFDEFVSRASSNPEALKRILKNKLYQQLSTTLSGSQEFTALEKLFSCYESGQFDLIVLDTPPTKHAIDFLQAPQKIAALFNEGIAKWFRQSSSGGFLLSVLHAGTKQVLKILEMLTGSEFMSELADFFTNIESWQMKLENRVTEVHRLLTANTTQFCLVTSFDEAKLKEAEYFAREINKGGFHLSGMIINRAYPSWSKQDPASVPEVFRPLYESFVGYYSQREELFKKFTFRMYEQGQIIRLPEMAKDISDLKGVAEVSDYLKRGSH